MKQEEFNALPSQRMRAMKERIEQLEARIAKTDALVEALTQISNAPSEILWGDESEIVATMNWMELIADAALEAYHKGSDT